MVVKIKKKTVIEFKEQQGREFIKETVTTSSWLSGYATLPLIMSARVRKPDMVYE